MRMLTVVLLLMLVSCPLLRATTPCHSQSLHWGVQEGDRYDFQLDSGTVNYSGAGEQNQVTYYVLALSPPQIPDPLTIEQGTIPVAQFQAYFNNGTIMQGNILDIAVPIGNWSLLTAVLAEGFRNTLPDEDIRVNFSESSTLWGYNSTWSRIGLAPPEASPVIRREIRYSKADGVLLYASTGYTYGNGTYYYERLTRLTIGSDIPRIVVTAGAAGVVILALGVLTYKRRRNK